MPLADGNLNGTGQPKAKANTMPSWSPPASGTVCINVDASFSEDSGEATAGIIMRDQPGTICLAASLRISRSNDAEEAEAKAIRLGLQIARDYELVPSSVLSDCFGAVSKANYQSRLQNRAWCIYEDIHRLNTYFPGCSISYTRRTLNSAAHELAQLAKCDESGHIWLPPLPTSISDIGVKDFVILTSLNE